MGTCSLCERVDHYSRALTLVSSMWSTLQYTSEQTGFHVQSKQQSRNIVCTRTRTYTRIIVAIIIIL